MIGLIPRFSPDYTTLDIIRAILLSDSSARNIRGIIKDLFKCQSFILLNNVRSGIYLILSLLPPGEIILPSFICDVVPQAVVHAGHRPIFVDIDCETFSMPVEQIKAILTPNTRAVIAAYLYGITWNLYELDKLCREQNIILIEDAAAAFGSKYNGQLVGITGDVTLFSFGKGKTLSSGRGGLLIINDYDLSKKIDTTIERLPLSCNIESIIITIGEKIIRQPCFYLLAYNMQKIMKGREFWEKGNIDNKKNISQYLYLMDNFNLKMLNNQLKIWQSHINRRIKIANTYRKNIKNPILRHINVSQEAEPAYSSYPLIVPEDREDFHKYMQWKGVDLGWSFNYSAAELCGQDNCINANKISTQIMTIPTYPHLSNQQVDYIVSEINKFKIKNKYDRK